MFEEWTAKDDILETLDKKGPIRYSELVETVGRPDKTVYVNLEKLEGSHLAEKDSDGAWKITLLGRNLLQIKRLIRSVKAIGLEEHFWAPGKLGYRSMKSASKMRRAYGEELAEKAENIVPQAAFRSLRLAQSPHLELSFDHYKRIQTLVGDIVKASPYSGPFALVLVYNPREALQRQIDDWPLPEKFSSGELTLMEREIRRLWTEPAWIEHVFG
jgi:hypothetical protein